MFSFIKKEKSDPQKTPLPNDVVFHTMQNDLDHTEGGVTVSQNVPTPSSRPHPSPASTAPFSVPAPTQTSSTPPATPTPTPTSLSSVAPTPASSFNQPPVSTPFTVTAPTPAPPSIPTPTPTPTPTTPTSPNPSVKPFVFPTSQTSPLHNAAFSDNSPVNSNISIIGEDAPHKNFATVVGVIFIILAILGGGAYYFITTRNITTNSVTALLIPQRETTTSTPHNNTSSISEPSFAIDKPNYLPLSAEKADAAANIKLLSQTAQEVLASGITSPIEFILTDQNNTPLGWKDFSAATNITLPEQLSSHLTGKFSLYIYNDQNRGRVSLSLETNNPQGLRDTLAKTETSLASTLTPLFLNESFKTEAASFQNSSYREVPIRYLNIDPSKMLSIDYGFFGNHLIIATSKNTGRAVLDKLLP
jgi:hypothetical protein